MAPHVGRACVPEPQDRWIVTSTRALLQDWEWYGWMMEAFPHDIAMEDEYLLWRRDLTAWERWRLSRAVKRHNRRQWREHVKQANTASATRPTMEEQ